MPKVGKTEALAALDDCLIVDHEKGTTKYESMSIQVETYAEQTEALTAMAQEYSKNGNQPLYQYIAVDTLDILEEIAVHKAAEIFKMTPMGKKWYSENYESPGKLAKTGDDILSLPNGAGYGYLRKAMRWYLDVYAKFCKRLIAVAHLKDKRLPSVDGVQEVIVKDISLTGKLGSILSAQADAIGYMYRQKDELMISFQTNDSAVMGSRCKHLAGRKFKFDWNEIYID